MRRIYLSIKREASLPPGENPCCSWIFSQNSLGRPKKEASTLVWIPPGTTYPREGSSSASKKIDQLLAATDSLLDLKQIDDASHQALTGRSNQPVLHFLRHLDEKKIPVWIRHVLVPA